MVALTYLDLLLLAPLLTLGAAKPLAPGKRAMKVQESRTAPARGYTAVAAASAEHMLELRVQLVASNMTGLQTEVMAMSTPGNPKYGQHMTKQQVEQFVAPCPDTSAAVKAWLDSHGLNYTTASDAGDWLHFAVPVAQANEMLDAKFMTFAHTSGNTAVRTLRYSIPTELEKHVAMVYPTTSFFAPSPPRILLATAIHQRPHDARLQSNGTMRGVVINGTAAANGTDHHGGRKHRHGSAADATAPIPSLASPRLMRRQQVCNPSSGGAPPQSMSAPPPSSSSAPPPPSTSSSGAPPAGTAAPGQTDESCKNMITPSCLQQLYGIPTAPATQSSNTLGVSGLLNQFAQQSDLSAFLGKFRPDISPSTTFALQSVDSGTNPQDPSMAGLEANLDTQYTVGVAQGVPVTFISTGENGSGSGFFDIVNALLGQQTVPQVLTTSYGQDEQGLGQDFATSFCNAYMMLAARGVSVIYSSGDSGVGPSDGSSCTTFAPTFPSGCPYITSVGASDGVAPEKAASFSSGGFSNLFPTPDYQKSAVSGYLSTLGQTNAGLFTPTGRAFPDVSAQGTNVAIFQKGQTAGVEGTSCSAPIFASIIALLNDELAAAGKPPLGLLNPWLYGPAAGAFVDVTEGSNPGCGTQGFPAAPGWDPVTGLGTPKYAALRTAAGL